MTNHVINGFIVFGLLLAGLAAQRVQADEHAAVAGTWALTVETSAGTGTPTLVLVQDGANLTGTYTGRFGDQPVTGAIEGNEIRFAFSVSGPMGSAVVTYTGVVDGDAMRGSMQMGSMAGGNFSGRRE
jgi:hypothetical protein